MNRNRKQWAAWWEVEGMQHVIYFRAHPLIAELVLKFLLRDLGCSMPDKFKLEEQQPTAEREQMPLHKEAILWVFPAKQAAS